MTDVINEKGVPVPRENGIDGKEWESGILINRW